MRNAALKNILDRNFLHLVEQPQLREQLGGVGAELCAVLAFGEAVRNGEKRLRRVQLRVLDGGLAYRGLTRGWLTRELSSRGYRSPSEVLLLTIDDAGRILCIGKDGAK